MVSDRQQACHTNTLLRTAHLMPDAFIISTPLQFKAQSIISQMHPLR